MNCDSSVERLPWLANGALPPEEAAEVRSHLDGCAACAAEWEVVRRTVDAFGVHPTVSELLDAADEGEEPGWVAGHLERCPDCREHLEMALDSRERLEASVEVAAPDTVRPSAGRFRPWPILALAASLLAAVGLLGWIRQAETAREAAAEVARLREETHALRRGREAAETRVAELAHAEAQRQALAEALEDAQVKFRREKDRLRRLAVPSADVLVRDLLPRSLTLRSGGEGDDPPAPGPDVETLVLRLNLLAEPPQGDLRVELRQGGRSLWAGERVRAGVSGEVAVAVPTEILEPGDAEVVLVGPDGNAVETFDLRLGPRPHHE